MTMLERVARAICYTNAVKSNEFRKASGSGHRFLIKTDDELRASVDKIWMTCADEARAAIEAMRTPTDKMIHYGNRARPYREDDVDYDGMEYRANTEGTWESMLDAALSEGKEGE